MLRSTGAGLSTESLVIAEIAQQPELWPTTLERVVRAGLMDQLKHLPVILSGAGTSAYAALAIAESWPGALAIPTTDLLLYSLEDFQSAMPQFARGGLLISLARSGDSPESVAVVDKVQKLLPAVRHLAIVCNANGRLAHKSGVQVICLDPRTNDQSLAMTSSFSNLALAGLCLLHHKEIEENLPSICRLVSDRLPDMDRVAGEMSSVCGDRTVVLASRMHALVEESALKIVELTAGQVTSMPQTFLGLRHGPMSFMRKDTAVVCFASSNPNTRRYEEDLIRDLKTRELGRVMVIGGSETSGWEHEWHLPTSAANLPDALRTPFEVPFSQLLAYHLSLRAGVNPDNPSPDGVVTRVVTPFNIHPEAAA